MKSYYEKLKDPRWQKKRLEIMERSGFCCDICHDKNSTLNVHHYYYIKNYNPWDYPDNALGCLCENCHIEIQDKCNELMILISHFKEFVPWEHFDNFFKLFTPHETDETKLSSLAEILINIYFKNSNKIYEESVKYCTKIGSIINESKKNGKKIH